MRQAIALVSVYLLAASAGMAAPARPGGEPVPQSIWQIDKQGAGRHLQSGLECPARAAGYRIQKITPFDAFGLDVGCNYWNQNGDAVTVYITRRDGQDLQADFDKANRELVVVHPEMQPTDAVDKPNLPQETSWLSSLYIDPTKNLRSGVWITDYSGWSFEFRASYPAQRAQQAFDAMTALADVAAKTAGAHLSACAAAAIPQRTGHKLEDLKELNALSLFVGMQLMADNGTDPKFANPFDGATAPVWCVEKTLQNENRGLVLWRNIASDGKRGPVDRVTVTALNAAPALEVIADPAGTSVAHSNGISQDAVIHAIAIRFGDRFETYAIFVDRPDLDALGALADQVFTRKSRPLSAYDKKTRHLDWSPQK